jgi:hypothetical protein
MTMQTGIFLSDQLLAGLSASARQEILSTFVSSLAEGSASRPVAGSEPPDEELAEAIDLQGWNQPADVSPVLFRLFMTGVSAKTSSLLEHIAKANGRAKMSELLVVSGHNHWRKLAGFAAGVTKRARRILRDSNARLLGWDKDSAEYNGAELIDGVYFVSAATLASMRSYFQIQGEQGI